MIGWDEKGSMNLVLLLLLASRSKLVTYCLDSSLLDTAKVFDEKSSSTEYQCQT